MQCRGVYFSNFVLICLLLEVFPSSLFGQKYRSQTDSIFFEAHIDSLVQSGQLESSLALLENTRSEAIAQSDWERAMHAINSSFRLFEAYREGEIYQEVITNKYLLSSTTSTFYAKSAYTQILGEYYLSYLNQRDSSLKYLLIAQEEFREHGYWEDYTYCTLVIGINYLYVGDYDTSENWCKQALDSAKVHLEPGSQAERTILNLLVTVYASNGDIDKFLSYSERSMLAYQSMQKMALVDSQHLAALYGNISTQLIDMIDYEQALIYIDQAKFLINNMSSFQPSALIFARVNEGIVYWRQGQKEKAHDIWVDNLSDLAGNESFEGKRQSFFVYGYLGEYARASQDYDLALTYLQRALGLQVAETRYKMSTMREMGKVYEEMGERQQAQLWYQKALVAAQETYQGLSPQISLAHIAFAQLSESQNDLGEALQHYQKGLEAISPNFSQSSFQQNPLIEDVIDNRIMLKLLKGKSKILKAMSNKQNDWDLMDLTASTYELAAALIDTMRLLVNTDKSKLRFAAEAQEIYENAIQVCFSLHEHTGDVELLKKAFFYAEKSKAIALREALRDSDAKQFAGIPDSLIAQEQKLKMDLAFFRKKIFDEEHVTEPDLNKIALWRNKQFARQEAFKLLIKNLEQNYPTYYQLKYETQFATADQLMQQLKQDEAIIEYVWGQDQLVGFMLTQNNIAYFSQPITPALVKQFSAFRNTLVHKPSQVKEYIQREFKQFVSLSADVYKSILGPFGKMDAFNNILIIPDGRLGYIPFEILLEEAVDTSIVEYSELPYFFTNHKLRYEYAASFNAVAEERAQKGTRFLGFAPSYEGSIWKLLQHNQEEVKHAMSFFDGQTFLGKKATKKQFRASASAYDILHFAMHGSLNDENPMYSGLVFSAEKPTDSLTHEFLHAYELYNMKLQAQLAVLSACHTGDGKMLKGEGIVSMARAFRYAGCPSIVMSLWAADDRATARFMEFFYRHLEDGKDKDLAISLAKKEYFASTRRDHPYYWAGFVLVGNGEKLQTGSNSLWYLLGLGFVILTSLIIYWLSKKGIFQN